VRAKKALYMVGALFIALAIAVVSSGKAEAAPTTASWYGPGFAGNPTASGEPFNPGALTAAHKSLPFGTQVEVCFNGCTTVTINDRGPYANGAEYDLSSAAADAIGLKAVGVGTVDATVLGQGGGTSEPAPEPTPEPAPAPEPAQDEAAPQQAAEPQQVAEPQASDVQNLSQEVEQSTEATTVNVFKQSPGVFVSNVVVPVGPEGYQAAYQQALEIAQQRANAAAGLI
jgi:rare lipoprotein A